MAFTKINAAGIGSTETVTVDGLTVINNLSVGGTVSIAGTLTYEDVTNVDSVGIITARSTIDAQGDISIADKIIHSGDTDTAIRFPAADTFSVETGGSQRLNIGSSGNVNIITGDLTLPDAIIHKEDLNTKIRFPDADTITAETAGSERLRITSAGRVTIGDLASPDGNLHVYNSSAGSVTAAVDANELVLESATNVGMSFLTANDSLARIKFADPDASNAGILIYSHADNSFRFQHTTDERLRITSVGRLLIGDDTARLFDGGNTPLVQISDNTSGRWARIASTTYIDSTIGGGIILAHSRNSTVGSHTVLANGDKLGSIFFEGSDGTQFARGAQIQAYVDGTPGTDDMPGRLEFSTTADGSDSPAIRATINSSGNFLIGNTSSVDVASGSGAKLQVKHSTGNISAAFYSTANASGPAGILALGHARDTVSGALQADDVMGEIRFAGGDGTDLESVGASIKAVVDATPGSNDMPGSLVFATTADGASSPTDHLKLNRNGLLIFLNAGDGVNFSNGHSVTANDATVSNNTLNDFEEGTLNWEIHKADYLTTGSNSSGSQVNYQKIGSMVYVQGWIRTDGTSPAGISGKAAILTDASGNRAQLPFTPSSPGAFMVSQSRSFNNTTTGTLMIAWDQDNDDVYVHLNQSNNYKGSQGDNATTTNQTNLVICFSGHYHTND